MRRTVVGFVFQAFNLMDELTAQENIELPALLAGRSVLPGSLLGIPLGMGLLKAVTASGDAYKLVPVWWFVLVVVGTWLVTGVLTAVPARIGSRHLTAQILQAELT